MTKNELLGQLWFIKQNSIDINIFIKEACKLLIEYINDEDITAILSEEMEI